MLPLIIGALEDQGEQQVHTAEVKPLETSSEAEETDLEELQKSLGQTPIEIFKGHNDQHKARELQLAELNDDGFVLLKYF